MKYYEIWANIKYQHPHEEELFDRDFDVKIHSLYNSQFTDSDALELAKKLAMSNPTFEKVTVRKIDDYILKEIKQ